MKQIVIERQLKIARARLDFYQFCKLEAPDFYTEDKPHLKEYCNVLQLFVGGKLLKENGDKYKILIIEQPPRHGKTRTLVLLSSWLLGRNNTFKIISTSYNDDEASSFSKYTRNTITEKRNTPIQIVYEDIFPKSKIKHGDASAHEWALEGQFFNYKGSGIGGTITGKGGNLIIVDDPVKNAEEAFNENHLAKLWTWYTGTLLSRKEHDAMTIICHTPWSKKDIGGRLQAEQEEDCFVFSRAIKNDKGMLCPAILDEKEFQTLERTMEPIIFSANYLMIRLDVKGLLYGDTFKTYDDFPMSNGEYLPREKKGQCDVADQGSDYLCHIHYDRCADFCFVTDVYYTKDDVTVTEEEMADRIIKCGSTEEIYEANAGGHAVAKHVEKILHEKRRHFKTAILTQDQRKNKEARILSNAHTVKDRIVFPANWKFLWPEFYKAVTNHMKEGKNKNDDAADCLTAIVEREYGDDKVGFAWV